MSNFIQEGSLFQEAKVIKQDPEKAVFRMTLQTADEENQNHRIYPKKVLTAGIDGCRERIEKKAFYSELDHPIAIGNDTFDGIRQTTVLLKEVCCIIRDTEWQGNHLVGELETTRTENGYKVLGLLRDHSGFGTSMRGMAELSTDTHRNVKIVQAPLYIIAFDMVSLPSHKQAVINFSEMRFENYNFLNESSVSCNNGMVCANGRCYLPNYFDKLVSEGTIKFFKHWI